MSKKNRESVYLFTSKVSEKYIVSFHQKISLPLFISTKMSINFMFEFISVSFLLYGKIAFKNANTAIQKNSHI
jgi:hypothetical protein